MPLVSRLPSRPLLRIAAGKGQLGEGMSSHPQGLLPTLSSSCPLSWWENRHPPIEIFCLKLSLESVYQDLGDENTVTQNLRDAVKAVLRGRFIPIQAYSRNHQINNPTLHLKQMEKKNKDPQS